MGDRIYIRMLRLGKEYYDGLVYNFAVENNETYTTFGALVHNCSGMCYPREFLEQGRTRASDKAWLAWQVTYGDAQLEIRRHIEHQLWEKHLWCVSGKSYRVPKQGVRARDRERRNTYVPKIQWRAESKWHMETRLKMDTQILNVANPVGPHLKLATEKDMAKTMGWRDVVFPTFQELERQLKRDEKIEKIKQRIELLKVEYMLTQAEKNPELLVGMKTDEDKEKISGEEKLKGQTEERLVGGVSRTTKESKTESKKGVAKPLGSTRMSAETKGKKKPSVEETVPIVEHKHELKIKNNKPKKRASRKKN